MTKVNVLLVDDQPAKLLANEEILRDLGENLVKTSSAREALEFLLKNDAAVVLIDVCMPELDGFQLAAMIRDHPRFQRTAIIFISAVQVDRRRPAARLRDGRGRLCAGAGRAGGVARQGQGVRRTLSQDARARTIQLPSWSDGSPSAPRSSRPQPRVCLTANSNCVWRPRPPKSAFGTSTT